MGVLRFASSMVSGVGLRVAFPNKLLVLQMLFLSSADSLRIKDSASM